MHNVCSAVSERIIGSGAVTEGKRKLVVDGMVRKAALMQMADAANMDGSGVYMSALRMAVFIECSEQSARRAMRSLEADGLIIDTGPITLPNGASLTNYTVNLERLRALPLAVEEFKEKRAVKVARKRAKAGGVSMVDTPKKASGVSTMDTRGAPTMDTPGRGGVSMVDTEPKRDIPSPSKEGSGISHMSDADAPNGGEEKKPDTQKGDLFGGKSTARGRGRRTPMAGEASEARRFWTRLRDSGLLHTTAKERCKPKLIDEQLAPILQVYGDELVAKIVGAYYKRQRKSEGGARAAALQTICEDGRLVDWLEEAKRTPCKAELTTSEAMKRLQSGMWRANWGDKDDPIYDVARDAIAKAREHGDANAAAA